MAKQTINIGTSPNDGTGSTLRDGGDLINDNFNEIYSAIGDGTTLTSGTFLTTTNSESVTNKNLSSLTNTFPTITIGDDTSTNFNVSLGGSFEIVGGSGINTAIDNNRIVLSTDGSIVTETSSDTLTNKTINAPDNTITNLSNSNLSGSAGITNANLSTPYITIGDDTSTNFNVNLGGSFEIVGGSGMATAINNNRIELSLSNVPNASLQNSSFTLGSDTINLGDTTTTITGLSLDGTGTIDLTGSGSKARFNFAGFGLLPTAATYEGMFAYDTTGQRPYVADAGGWVRLLDENSSVSAHADVNITGIADGYILKWSSAQGRFNVVAETGSSFTTDKSNTGDGSTLAFTINSGRTVDDILVFVNGICLVPTDDYTVSGTTLTFQIAPAASAEIVIRYLG